jgi:hypothetical protein
MSGENGPPWEGYIDSTSSSSSFRQLSINCGRFTAKMGRPGERRMGKLFMAMSPTIASPESNSMLIDPDVWPGV